MAAPRVVLGAAVLLLACGRAAAQPLPLPELLSLDLNLLPANGHSLTPAVSADGRRVVFASEAQNLVVGDTNRVMDVFLRERDPDPLKGLTRRLSVAGPLDVLQGDAPSDQPAISLRGNAVAFRSLAALLPEDRSRLADIYLRDLDRGATELVSVALRGEAADGEASGFPSLSEDGSLVGFLSAARNLAGVAGNGKVQVYLRDRRAGRTELVSLGTGGRAGEGDCLSVALNRDGRYVAFSSLAEDLVEEDRNRLCDIFLRDRLTGQTTLVSVGPDGRPANGLSEFAAISPDGRTIAFASQATNFSAEDRDAKWDVYVRDRAGAPLELVSRRGPGAGQDGDSLVPALGLEGRLVVFHSTAQLAAEDRNTHSDAYVYDRLLGETSLLSRARGGAAGNGASESVRVSEDGALAVFQSAAEDLTADQNRRTDIFGVRPAAPPAPPRPPARGGLLFRTADGRIAQLRPDGTATGRQLRLAPQDELSSFTFDNENVLWVLLRNGLLRRFGGDDLAELPPPVRLPGPPGAGDLVAAGGFAWIPAEPPGVIRIDRRGALLEARPFPPGATSVALALDPFGSLWAAIGEPPGGRLVQLSRDLRAARSFRASERFLRIAFDQLGNLHGLSADAVSKFSPAGARFYRAAFPAPRALAVDGRGRALVVHRDAVAILDPAGRRAGEVPHAVPLLDRTPASLVLDGRGRAWASSGGAILLRRIDLGAGVPALLDLPLLVLGAGTQSGDDLGGDRSGFAAAGVIDPRGDADLDGIENRIELQNGLDPLDDQSPAPGRKVLPVQGLGARALGQNQVEVSWSNPVAYARIHVLRDRTAVAGSPFAGATRRIVDRAPGGPHEYTVFAVAEGGAGAAAGGALPGGGAEENSPEVSAVVVVGDGSEKACVDLPDHPYALAYFPAGGGRIVVSSADPELPLFDAALAPVDLVFPHPAPGAEIRGIEYDGSVPGGRLLFLLADRRVFRTNLDGSGASLLVTLAGGPEPAAGGHSGLALRGETLFALLGPGYDCLVGYKLSDGSHVSDANLSDVLKFQVEQSLGLQIAGDRAFVGIGEEGSQATTDVVQLNFAGPGIVDAGINLPLEGTGSTLITDIEFQSGQGLYAVDANRKRLCLLEANFDASPLIETITPQTGPPAGGTAVTLGVKNLISQADTQVEIAGGPVPILAFQDGADPSRKVLRVSTPPHAPGGVRVEVVSSDGRSFVDPGFTYLDGGGGAFVRGNADGLGGIDITDAQFILNFLFLGGGAPPCLDAADVTDDGVMDITDATSLLSFLFLGGEPPREPHPAAGVDTTDDALDC